MVKNESKGKKPMVDEDLADFDDEVMEPAEQPAAEQVSGSKGALEHPSYQELETKLTETENRATDNWNKLLRLQADFENARRRNARDVDDAEKYGVQKLIKEIIPVLDGIEEGLKIKLNEDSSVQKFHEGMEMSLQMLLKALEKVGVIQVDPIGESFNPDLHEAMAMQEQEGAAPNSVIAVLQKGYRLHERLIRPARVIVAK